MKHKVLLTIAIIILSIFTAQSISAQININIPWGKKKKEEKKVETNPTPKPETVKQSESNQSTTPPKVEKPVVQDNPLGKIYFSNKPFPAGGSVEGAKTSFTSNEFIYGRLVLNGGTVKDVMKPSSPSKEIPDYSIPFKVYVLQDVNISKGYNGSSGNLEENRITIANTAVISNSSLEKTFWDFDILPNPSNYNTWHFFGGSDYLPEAVNDFYLFLTDNKTKEGSYTFGVTISGDTLDFRGNKKDRSEWLNVSNSLTYTFEGDDYAKIKSNYEILKKTSTENLNKQKAANTPLPKEWTLKTNAVAGGFTEARLRTMYLNDRSQYGQSLKIIKFYTSPVKQSYWYVDKNSLGIPKYMYSSQWYQLFVQNLKDNSCFYQHFQMERNYTGGGTYSAVFPKIMAETPISCEKLGVK